MSAKTQEEMDHIMEQTKALHEEIKDVIKKHMSNGVDTAAVASALATHTGFITAVVARQNEMTPVAVKGFFDMVTKSIRSQSEAMLKSFLERDIEEAADELTKAVAKDAAKKEQGRWR